MEIKIGVQHTPREITLESTQSPEDVQETVNAALSGTEQVLRLTDERGRVVLVPADRLAYVEIGEHASRRVGFGAV